MKNREHLISLSLLLSCTNVLCVSPIELTIIPAWDHLDTNPKTIEQFGGTWILAGTLEVKKRSSESIKLDKLVLRWHGKRINNLLGSLYKKDLDKAFIPIEDYLICDSIWDQASQKLILQFDTPLTLEAHTTFCLVLTIPRHLESTMNKGSFHLEITALPLSLQRSISKPLSLACGPYSHSQNPRS
jgi:hypothetical protein